MTETGKNKKSEDTNLSITLSKYVNANTGTSSPLHMKNRITF